jgi:hypothetical protein
VNPDTITLTELPAVALDRLGDLPDIPAIYFIFGGGKLLKVMKAASLRQDASANPVLEPLGKRFGDCRIAWKQVDDVALLDELMSACIYCFKPIYDQKRLPSSVIVDDDGVVRGYHFDFNALISMVLRLHPLASLPPAFYRDAQGETWCVLSCPACGGMVKGRFTPLDYVDVEIHGKLLDRCRGRREDDRAPAPTPPTPVSSGR